MTSVSIERQNARWQLSPVVASECGDFCGHRRGYIAMIRRQCRRITYPLLVCRLNAQHARYLRECDPC